MSSINPAHTTRAEEIVDGVRSDSLARRYGLAGGQRRSSGAVGLKECGRQILACKQRLDFPAKGQIAAARFIKKTRSLFSGFLMRGIEDAFDLTPTLG